MHILPLLAVVTAVSTYGGCTVKASCSTLDACTAQMKQQHAAPDWTGGLDDEGIQLSAGFEALQPKPIDVLIGFLASSERRQREIAAHALGRLRSKRAVPALLHHLDDTDWASWALGEIGDPVAIPALVERVERPGGGEVLQRLGRAGAEALAALVVDRSATAQRRQSAAFALSSFPSGADAAVPMLRAALRAPDPTTTELVLGALRGLGPVASAAIPEVRALHDEAAGPAKSNLEDVLVRLGDAALAAQYAKRIWTDPISTHMLLADLGPAASPAVPELIHALQSERWAIREDAAHALGLIRDPRAVDALIASLTVRNWQLNVEAARALGRIGPAAQRATASLRELERHHWSAVVRDAAGLALRRINGERMPEVRPWLDVPQVAQDHRDEGSQSHGRSSLTDARRPLTAVRWRGAWLAIDDSWQPHGDPPAPVMVLPLSVQGRETYIEVADGWLVGRDCGEWGGEAIAVGNDGNVERVVEGNIFGFARVGDALFAITAVGFNYGSLVELTVQNGHWHATPLVALPGEPGAFKVVDDTLLVVTRHDVAAIGTDGSVQLLVARADDG